MEQLFGWCFIGTGSLANQVASELQRKGGHKIVSVYSRRFEKAKEFCKKHEGEAYASAEEAIMAPGVQGVYIVTPHNSHYQYAKQAIELGKPVLCEKPITTDANKAKELFALAKERNVYLVEAMWTWFSPIAYQVKKWIDEGEYGEIESIFITYHVDIQRHARLIDPNLAGGILLDCGIYPITYLYRLFGKPVKIVCEGMIRNGVDMKEEIDLSFSNGKTFHASASMMDFKGLERLVIKGSDARTNLRFFHFADKVKLIRKHGRNSTVRGSTSYKTEFDCVAAEILAGKTESDYVPPSATIDVLEIMDECRRQMGLVYPFEKE